MDLDIFTALIQWLEQGKASWLCTVTSTWGSSPRNVGSLMACNVEGQQIGSLSGGCIEEDLLERISQGEFSSAHSSQPSGSARHLIYGATQEEIERFKLPCGGSLGVLMEPLSGEPETRAWLKSVRDLIEKRQCIVRSCDWRNDGRTLLTPPSPEDHGGQFHFQRKNDQPLLLRQVYGPPFHLFLIGVSEVSRALAKFALLMDYRVSVCDPRAEQIQSWDIDNITLIKAMPDDAVLQYADDERSAILALTHDPRIDDMGLMQAFNTKAFYIGAMGSMATSRKRRERLQQVDVDATQLQRLHAPIGLPIGSKTPAEIAIAILAELSQVRSQL